MGPWVRGAARGHGGVHGVRPGECEGGGTESSQVRQTSGWGWVSWTSRHWPVWVDWHGECGERDGWARRVTGFG